MIRISFIFFTVLILGFVPGCLAAGSLSSKTLQNGNTTIIKGENFNEDTDLTEILEFQPSVPGVMKAIVKGSVVFEKCNFYKFIAYSKKKGKSYIIEFQGDVVFDECMFRDTVAFDYMIVKGDFYAGKSEFMGPATFKNTWFKGRNNIFSSTLFYQDAWFNNVIFENRARFFRTEFNQAAMFQSSVFKGQSFFGAAAFKGYTDFGNSHFMQDMDMAESRFTSRSNFSGMNVLMTATFGNAEFSQNVDFSKSVFYLPPSFPGADFQSGQKGLSDYLDEEIKTD